MFTAPATDFCFFRGGFTQKSTTFVYKTISSMAANLSFFFRLQGITVYALHAVELHPVFEQLRLQPVQLALVGQTFLLRRIRRKVSANIAMSRGTGIKCNAVINNDTLFVSGLKRQGFNAGLYPDYGTQNTQTKTLEHRDCLCVMCRLCLPAGDF